MRFLERVLILATASAITKFSLAPCYCSSNFKLVLCAIFAYCNTIFDICFASPPQPFRGQFLHFPKSMSRFLFFSKNRAGTIFVGPVFFGANALPRAGIDFSDCKRNY